MSRMTEHECQLEREERMIRAMQLDALVAYFSLSGDYPEMLKSLAAQVMQDVEST